MTVLQRSEVAVVSSRDLECKRQQEADYIMHEYVALHYIEVRLGQLTRSERTCKHGDRDVQCWSWG